VAYRGRCCGYLFLILEETVDVADVARGLADLRQLVVCTANTRRSDNRDSHLSHTAKRSAAVRHGVAWRFAGAHIP
jgi:hypothetical protein